MLEFIYLGCKITNENNMEAEILQRISNANECFFALQKTFKSKYLCIKTKLHCYRTIVQSVLCYGSNTWTLTKRSETVFYAFENKILRKIFGPVLENG